MKDEGVHESFSLLIFRFFKNKCDGEHKEIDCINHLFDNMV
ncbi:MAG: hypothetical protein ACHQJ4_01945 [Ignavibacteria bacterium]